MASVLQSRLRVASDTFELQMKRRRLIATIALVLLLEQSMIGISPFSNFGINAANTGGDFLRQAIVVGILGLQFFAPSNARPPMAVPVSLLVLLGYCLLTCFWAIDPSIALRRLAFTALVIVILVRAIGDLGAVRTLNVVRATLVALLVINILVVLLTPYGKHGLSIGESENVAGDWRGIMQHKNAAGAATALTVILFAFDRSRLPRLWTAGVLVASLFFLLMTNSKTSIAMLVIAGATGAIMQLYNPRHRSLVVPLAVMGTFGLICLCVMYLGAIQNVLDDPTAFTGRAQIWPLLLEYAGEHLWTGAGYMSFWQIGNASPIWTLTNDWVAAEVGHGHNGYLDILVTIGLPGLLLTIAVLFVWPAMKLLVSTDISRPRRGLFAAMIMFSLGHNMTESTLLDRATVVHVFLMIAVILVHRLSSQSAGAHHAIRNRLMHFADRRRLAGMRGRLAASRPAPRPLPGGAPTRPDVEDGIA
jgi:O-antigen ligase